MLRSVKYRICSVVDCSALIDDHSAPVIAERHLSSFRKLGKGILWNIVFEESREVPQRVHSCAGRAVSMPE